MAHSWRRIEPPKFYYNQTDTEEKLKDDMMKLISEMLGVLLRHPIVPHKLFDPNIKTDMTDTLNNFKERWEEIQQRVQKMEGK